MSKSQQTAADGGLVRAVAEWLERLPDQDAPIGATVEFKVKASEESTFLRHSELLAAETRKQPGLDWYSYDAHQPDAPPPEDPLQPPPHRPTYIIIEHWRSVREFREQQWGSKHLTSFQSKVADWLEEPPDRSIVLKFIHGSAVRTEVLSTGPYNRDRFQSNRDGTVTDNETGLIWLEDANAFGELPWAEALRKAAHLGHGQHGLGDHSEPGDWRTPNVNELQSLLDLTNTSGPAVSAGHPFKQLTAANYWSSTSVAAFPALGWYVATAVGPPVFDLKTNKMRLWPVKGRSLRVRQTGQDTCWDSRGNSISCAGTGQDAEKASAVGMPLATPRFHVNLTETGQPDGTVTDRTTGLTWLRNADLFGTLNWWDAVKACENLCHDQQKGLLDHSQPGEWALPDVNELRSLEDYGEARPALAKDHKTLAQDGLPAIFNVRESLVWSSTEVESTRCPGHREPTLARFLYVGIGSCVWDHKAVLCGVWPVKRRRKQPS